jgi:hypothetical protein
MTLSQRHPQPIVTIYFPTIHLNVILVFPCCTSQWLLSHCMECPLIVVPQHANHLGDETHMN